MQEWMVGGASEKPGAGGARDQPGRVKGRWSHGVDDLMEGTLGTTDGEAATNDGDPDGADEPMCPREKSATGDRGGAATSVRSGTGNPEDRG